MMRFLQLNSQYQCFKFYKWTDTFYAFNVHLLRTKHGIILEYNFFRAIKNSLDNEIKILYCVSIEKKNWSFPQLKFVFTCKFFMKQ